MQVRSEKSLPSYHWGHSQILVNVAGVREEEWLTSLSVLSRFGFYTMLAVISDNKIVVVDSVKE